MDKVRSLSLIELTALFDSHGLALHRRKAIKRRVRGEMMLYSWVEIMWNTISMGYEEDNQSGGGGGTPV